MYPLFSKEAEEVADSLHLLMLDHSVIEITTSDRGTEFNNKVT